MTRLADRRSGRGFVLSREHFARISAVDGIMPTAEMRETFDCFDREGLSDAERRHAIIKRFAAATLSGAGS